MFLNRRVIPLRIQRRLSDWRVRLGRRPDRRAVPSRRELGRGGGVARLDVSDSLPGVLAGELDFVQGDGEPELPDRADADVEAVADIRRCDGRRVVGVV